MRKAIITGPTGAIGTALIDELIAQEIKVLAVCRKGTNRRGNITKHPLVKIVECDLDKLEQLPLLDSDTYDVFYHFGWDGTFGNTRNNMPGQVRNIQYTLDAVDVAQKMGCRRFVGAGSQAEYGRVEGILTPDAPAFPENGYGMAKLCAGQMSRVHCRQLEMEHIWTRVLSIYGPHDGAKTMIMSTIDALRNQKVPPLTKGEQIWDYLYSKDAGRAFYLLGEKGINEKTYCVGSGVGRPLKEYMEILRDAVDPKAEIGIGQIPYAPQQVMHLVADISELKADTGFEVKYSFEKGIQETIASVSGLSEYEVC